MRYVDLTMGLSDHMEVWSGDPEVSLSVHTTIEEHGCRTMRIAMGTHNGTHIDSPAHLIPGGKSLDQVAVERFFARSYVLDTAGCALVTSKMVSDLPPGCTGILFCGADSYLDEGAARLLLDQGYRLFGFEAASCDEMGSSTLPVHHILLEGDALIIECLVNLEPLSGRIVELVALPLLVDGSDGAPSRVVALLDD